MIPVYMSRFFDVIKNTQGNHLACCLASVLELPLGKIPKFEDMARDEMLEKLILFLLEHKIELVLGNGKPHAGVYSVALGKISTGMTHSAVYFDNKLVHNPHPLALPFMVIDEFIALHPKKKKAGQGKLPKPTPADKNPEKNPEKNSEKNSDRADEEKVL